MRVYRLELEFKLAGGGGTWYVLVSEEGNLRVWLGVWVCVLRAVCVCWGYGVHWVSVRCGCGCACVGKAGMCLDACVGEPVLCVLVYGVWECGLALCVCVGG